MATLGNSDATVFVPPSIKDGTIQFTPLRSDLINGLITSSAPTTGVSVEVRSGAIQITGAPLNPTASTFNQSSWNLQGPNTAFIFTNTSLTNSTITGDTNSNTVVVGNSSYGLAKSPAKARTTARTKDTSVSLDAGNDSIAFAKRSQDKNSSLDLGTGADSITFARSAQAKRSEIDLGVDNDGDSVKISKLDDLKKVVIDNFGKSDTLKIGGKTYDYADLKERDGKFGNNLKVNLD